MSKLPAIIPTTDLTESELHKVKKFTDDGMPGIADVADNKLYRMLDLYLNGSTYTQIASMLEIKKVFVLYFAHKGDWFQMKQEYLAEAAEKIKNRVVDAKLRNNEFMLLLVQAWQKKIGTKLTRYLATNDDEHMEDIDLKEVAQLMKAIDMVNELDNTGKDPKGKAPLVGLNMGNGVVVEKIGDNQLSITPKETSIGAILQEYADDRRAKEKLTLGNQTSDINTKRSNDEGK